MLSVVVMAVLLGYAGCGPEKTPETPIEEQQLNLLSATWKVGANGNVTLGGVSKKSDYSNFTLTISGTAGASSFGYTTAGRPQLSAWPSSGNWTFGTDVKTTIVRDGGTGKALTMNYTVSATGDQLELTFNYTGAGETRTSNVAGAWVFTLTK